MVGRGGFALNGKQSGILFRLMYLAMLAGPSIAGMVGIFEELGWKGFPVHSMLKRGGSPL
jgi:hypothetical protein